MAMDNSVFVVRESFGTYGQIGPAPYKQWDALTKAEEETRFTTLSRDGKYFAIGRASTVNIFKTEDGSQTSTVNHRMISAQFSPQNRYLIAWENPGKGVENFKIWSLDGEPGKDQSGKKVPKIAFCQQTPRLPEAQFSWNDEIYSRLSNDGKILFYSSADFNKIVASTSSEMKISNYALSPGTGQSAFVCYVKGGQQQGTSHIRMYKFPDVDNKIAQRSSFQSDRVSIKWNRRGTAVLVTTMTDVDKTGVSYYGKTALEYLDVKGEAYRVQLDSAGAGGGEGDLHACQWSPNSTEFCIIVGKMPNTRAALLNLKGERILDMDVAARNEIYFNPQGNIVLVCGLGNLPGNIEVWELKKHKKCIARFRAQNATQVEWLNDGAHFITATTAPRMQVDNGYKVWDFTGKSVFEWKAVKHLFGITSFAAHEQDRSFPDEKLEAHVKSTAKMNLKGENAPVYVPVHKRKGVIGSPMPAKPVPQTKSGAGSGNAAASSQDSDKEKKIRSLQKKIQDIQKLISERDSGKKLEINQHQKIEGLDALQEELDALSVS